MIKIGKPRIYTEKEKAYLAASVTISDEAALRFKERTEKLKNCLWRTNEDYPPQAWQNGGGNLFFEVDKKYADCLCAEGSDAFVIAMLWYAVMTEEDISFEVPMSKRLHEGLTQVLLPALCSEEYRLIKLTGPLTCEKLECKGAVGTGMTCGIDSFYTLRTHKLTHLAYYDSGHTAPVPCANGGKLSVKDYYNATSEIADKNVAFHDEIARQNGLEFLYIKTNIEKDFYRGGAIYKTMYDNLACTLAVQKLFKTYISSSSGHGGDLESGLAIPSQNYENLICDCCKTETLDFISSDRAKRFEKIEKLADDSTVAEHLDVCFNYLCFNPGGKNCGECYGCLKTMVVLDLLGKLDNFEKSFDLEKYYADRRKYIKILYDGTLRPELASLRESWADITEFANAHQCEAGEIIKEFNRRCYNG